MLGFFRKIGLGISLSLIGCLGFAGGSLADWKSEWEKTLAAAKKEGRLNISISRYGPVLSEFKKAYPEIKVVAITSGSRKNAERMMSEQKAGVYNADVFSGGANTTYNLHSRGKAVASIKDAFILPEVKDASKWAANRWADPEGKYVFAYENSASSTTFIYNTKTLDPKKYTSYWDLLKPELKGKMIGFQPTDTRFGSQMIFWYYHPDLGPKFIERYYRETDQIFSRNQRQMTDGLAKGRYLLCIGCRPISARKQGLPIEFLIDWKEGSFMTPRNGALALPKRAAHPNAAKVYINWFLSREGQLAFQKIGDGSRGGNSRRIDIPKDMVHPELALRKGVKYFDTNKPKYQVALVEVIRPMAKKIIAERRKRKK